MDFDFYDTEAAHLAEIYDGDDAYFEEYSTYEKREYIADKENRFNRQDVGKYVVVQTPRKNKKVMRRLYLVDRNKTKRFWWSHDALYAMVFNDKSAAELQAKRYKYNNTRVVEIKSYMTS
ncbi:MAG: hypothetical protein IJM58_06680 [Muribaculaceae bacterium]|nr:hypothetical protein [Muribaculaceae bacterium]